jgi:hypothetical protein
MGFLPRYPVKLQGIIEGKKPRFWNRQHQREGIPGEPAS